MSCSSCGRPTRPGARFCGSCGAPIHDPVLVGPPPPSPGRACAACGASNVDGARFCRTCGGRLVDKTSPSPQTGPDGPGKSAKVPLLLGTAAGLGVLTVVASVWWFLLRDADGDESVAGASIPSTETSAAPSTAPDPSPATAEVEAVPASTGGGAELSTTVTTTVPGSPVTLTTQPPFSTAPPVISPPLTPPTVPGGAPALSTEDLAEQQILAYHAEDSPVVESLVGWWVPQVSSKRVGLEADGIIYDNRSILADHERHRSAYDAVLLHSTDFVFRTDQEFWITVVPLPFGSGAEALEWCRGALLGPDDCYAKLITRDESVEDTTEFQSS